MERIFVLLRSNEVTLRQGQTSVDAPVECQTEGSRGNLAAGILNVMITPVPGHHGGEQSGANPFRRGRRKR